MVDFGFAPGSPVVGAVGGCAVDGAGVVFIPAHCDGGVNFQLWRFQPGVGFSLVETVNETVYGKFGPSSCVIIGADVLCLLSVRDASGKQRLAKAWYRGIATPVQSRGLSRQQGQALDRLMLFLGV
jgi:hypothetical protein